MPGANSLLDFQHYITGGQALTDASQSVRALKKDVTAFSKAVDQDGDRIKAALEKITAALKGIRSQGETLNIGGSESDRQKLRELIQEVARLKKEQDGLKGAADGAAAAQRNAREAAGLYTKELKEQREALLAATKAGDAAAQKQAALNIKALSDQQKEFSRLVRGTATELTAAAGSYNAANQELIRLRAEYRALGGVLDGANPRAAELAKRIDELDGQLRESDATLRQAYRNVGNYTQSILDAVRALEAEKKQLEAGAAALRQQAKATGLSAEQQQKLQQELEETDQALDKVNKDLKGYGVGLDDATKKGEGFGSGIKKYLLTVGLALFSFEALGQAAQQVFRSNVEFSDQLADVRKTTGLTADEADRLAGSLKKLDTRTSLQGLLDIAKTGGQLGIAKEDILGFTKAVDVAVQALGDDFSGGAAQIADELGKISNVFRKELGPDVAENLLSIGSAVNEIGASGASTAPFLTDVALRVGAVAAQTKVGLSNVLAYAAVLEETGSTSERAGTSLNRLFSTLSTKTEESFRIAQKANPALTLKEFTRLVNTDFNAAVQLFLKGLNAGGKTTTELSRLLATLKLDSGEAKSAIITLAQNTDLFAQRQAVANAQLKEGTSLAQEAGIKNETLAGSVNKLTNDVSNFFTSGAAGRFLKFFVDLVREDSPVSLLGGLLNQVGDGIDKLKQKTGLAKKDQVDYAAATVNASNSLTKQIQSQQKLLDSYTTLGAVVNKTGAQQLEYARLGAKVQAEFGTREARAIQASIEFKKSQVEANRKGLESELNYYDKEFLPGLSARAAKAQEAVNGLNLSPALLEQYRKIAAARLEGARSGVEVDGKSLVDDKKIAVLQRELEATERLTKEQQRRAQIAAALLKIQGPAATPTVNPDEVAAAEEEITGIYNRAAKERAAARRADLENQLAEQLRLIEQTKKFQDEQNRQFEAKLLNEEQYAAAVAGTQDTILTAEKNAAQLRINLAKSAKDEAVAQADEELNAVKRKKNVGQAEIQDAESAHYFRLQALALKYKGDRLKIEQDLQDKLLEYSKSLDFRPVGVSPDALAKAERDLDLSNERGLKRMQDDVNRRKELYDQDAANAKAAEEIKQRIREQALDVAMQAANAFFDFQQQRNQQTVQNLEAAQQRELDAAGDNAELKAQIEEDYQKRIAEAKRKAARDERTAALFNIAVNTAVAVAKTIAEFGFTPAAIPFVALAAATGAIQAAAVLAAPIPQYFKGRQGGPAEWAEVAERGPELIDGSRGVRLATRRQITHLEAGAKVYTADKTRELLRASEAAAAPRFGESLGLAQQQLSSAAPAIIRLDKLEQGQDRLTDVLTAQKAYHTRNTRSLMAAIGTLRAGSGLDARIAQRTRRG